MKRNDNHVKKPKVQPTASDDPAASGHGARRGALERPPGTIRSRPDNVRERGPDSGGGKLRPDQR